MSFSLYNTCIPQTIVIQVIVFVKTVDLTFCQETEHRLEWNGEECSLNPCANDLVLIDMKLMLQK